MGRRDYEHTIINVDRGINQQPELARPGEVADARNMWAPDGRAVSRPGTRGVLTWAIGSVTTQSTSRLILEEDPSGTPSYTNVAYSALFTLNNVAVGSRVYLGITEDLRNYFAITYEKTADNSANTYFTAHYYNGTAWRPFSVVEYGNQEIADTETPALDSGVGKIRFLGASDTGASSDSTFTFVPPADWASTTVDSQTRYYIRLTLQGEAMDGSAVIRNTPILWSATSNHPHVAAVCEYATTKRYIIMTGTTEADMSSLELTDLKVRAYQGAVATKSKHILGTYAVVPEFEETFISIEHTITVHDTLSRYLTTSDASTTQVAQVEDRSEYVGEKASYSTDYIAQRTTFPQAKYIMFFKGRLWAANLLDRPNDVAWSAPQPYYKVWPLLSQEPIMEDDNSPITGMAALNEQVVIFKRDSIWIMVSTGLNSFGLETFAPVKVVAGVGAVSHHSIKAVRGNLIFLGEDGIYSFDGTPAIRKATERSDNGADRLREFFKSVTGSRREFAFAAHWRKYSTYLLAISVDGSDNNNRVIAWDYSTDAWWIWDNLEVALFVEDEDRADDEVLYFFDFSGGLHVFDTGKSDNYTAFTSYLLTHQIGLNDNVRKRVRQVEVTGSSVNSTCTVEVWPNDSEANKESGSLVFTDRTETANIVPARRAKRLGFKSSCDHFQVKVSQATVDTPLIVTSIDAAYIGVGRR